VELIDEQETHPTSSDEDQDQPVEVSLLLRGKLRVSAGPDFVDNEMERLPKAQRLCNRRHIV
jgi:hypothetical protein